MLTALGLFAATIFGIPNAVFNWTARIILYVASFYFLAGLLSAMKAESFEGFETAGISERWADAFRGDSQQFKTLFSKMLNGFSYSRIIVNDSGKPVDFVFLATNEAFERMTGLKSQEVIEKRASEVLPGIENDPADWIGTYGRVALTGQSVNFKNYSVDLEKWYLVSAYSPRKGYFIAIFDDITARKKAEDKLEEYANNLEALVEDRTKKLASTALYARRLIEASLDPLVTISLEGEITDVNESTEMATGCKREELIGSDFSNYFTEPEKARMGYQKVFADGFVKDYPLAILHKSGKITDVLYNANIYTNEAGEMQGVFAAARDITELKKAEAQAQEAAKKLKDSERLAAIGATAGMVGHDIRNPLQAITGDLYLVKTELAELPDHQQKKNAMESLDEIQNNIDYINKIVADLQDYARPLNPRAQETDLTSVFKEMLTKNGIPKNVKINVDVEDKARNVMADPDYLKRIVGNLTLNAVQAMPDGGELTIRAYLDKQTNDTLITVRDTGVGIPDDVKLKLFTPMMTTKSKGQEFGLAVVKRMTEGLGGTVTFESTEGKGTTFIVSLPTPKS